MASAPHSPHIPVREDWLARGVEPPLEPALPIVDPHHHLWDRPGDRYLFDDLLRDTRSGHDIRATVFVTCRAMFRAGGPEAMRPVGETEFVNGVAAQSASGLYGKLRACQGIVGFADLTLGERVAPVLEAHLRAAPERFRGIRNNTAFHPDPAIQTNPVKPREGLLADPAFLRGAALLPRHGLTLDVWAYHTQLAEVEALARALPDLTVILDHMGGPIGIAGRREEVFGVWRAAMRRLAALPNLRVKLGGLGMALSGFDFHRADTPPGSATLAAAWAPYVETCIELFGARRCMFESNFSVDKGMFGYGTCWNAFKRIAAAASADEKAALFAGTAIKTYRLPPHLGQPRPTSQQPAPQEPSA